MACWFQYWEHSFGHYLPTFLPLNALSSNNNNKLEQGDIEHEADNSREESINTESRPYHEDTIETINEEIKTVEESNDENKFNEIKEENELGYIIKENEIIITSENICTTPRPKQYRYSKQRLRKSFEINVLRTVEDSQRNRILS